MQEAGIEVIKAGLSTSIQDLGRTGYQRYGMVVAGAMDPFALRVGNLLVGNEEGAAGIEAVVQGPELRFLKKAVIAVCGASLSPKLDGAALKGWKAYPIEPGQTLSFGKPVNGAYAYIAVSGGIMTEMVMGSRATYRKGGLGGLQGDTLQAGDVLPIGTSLPGTSRIELHPELIPDYQEQTEIRVILGPDLQAFTEEGVGRFLRSSYAVTPKMDRMGAKLEGGEIPHVNGADIISDAIFPGTIQVPANGQPIVMFADRQPTGGYTRIATIITEDIPRVAQSLPGKEITFKSVSLKQAHTVYHERQNLLQRLRIGTLRI